jgi:hypothetical protein
MTEHEHPTSATGPEEHGEDVDRALADSERSVRSLLKKGRVSPAHGNVDLLGGVQRKIRQRSRGRFYADGWSTGRATTSTYVVTALLMLGILLIAYFVLMPAFPAPKP